ncbi:intersectin-1-like [Culex pipiens pallens]|uniref:intersectin-1-like n=1 Tax=Culex pipiens pallens TaxID=42434 RepID=UPI0019536B4E|nr:intersectin-1-like [Culex pipiens pallens]
MQAADPFVITTRERAKYDEQFKSLQPVNGVVTGGQAKGFFLQSQLPPMILGQIWALADTDSDGKMTLGEFSIACKLINLKLRGFEVPKTLPPTLIASLTAVGGTPTLTPTTGLSPLDPLKSLAGTISHIPPAIPPQPAMIPHAIVPPMRPAMPPQPLIAAAAASQPAAAPLIPMQPLVQPMGTVPQPAMMQQVPAQAPLIAGFGMPPVQSVQPLIDPIGGIASPPLVAGIPPIGSMQPLIGGLPGAVPMATAAVPAPPTPPSGTGTPQRTMSISERAPSIESPQSEWAIKGPAKLKYTQLFNTTDRNRSGFLTGPQARNIMVQTKLPQANLAQIWALADMDSDGRLGCEEFVLAMYLCDLALQGEKVPAVLPPELIPPSFRKATSRHGSVVGSRHGSVSSQGGAPNVHAVPAEPLDPLSGLPMSSFEDKRKENYDKGQAELDRRRKALMDIQKKEQEETRPQGARRSRKRSRKAKTGGPSEKQQGNWREATSSLSGKRNRSPRLLQQRQREQGTCWKLKGTEPALSVELSTFNEKIKELSQKICDTSLKSKVKVQNQRLVQLSQQFSNKQIIIQQLKDKLENTKQQIENKTTDIELNSKHLVELKSQLTDLIDSCEKLYHEYDMQRIQILEMKNNRKNESYTSAWDTSNSWPVNNEPVAPAQTETTTSMLPNDTVETPPGFVKYRAIYEFSARNADEITFQPGDIIMVPLEQNAEPGWLAGEINGHTGWFPETYVEKVDSNLNTVLPTAATTTTAAAEPFAMAAAVAAPAPEPETIAYSQEPVASADDYTTAPSEVEGLSRKEMIESGSNVNNNLVAATYNGDVEYYVACYAYQSAEIGDLVFDTGEVIAVTKKEGDWWTGNIGNRTGIFPSNYVQKQESVSTALETSSEPSVVVSEKQEAINGNQQISSYDQQQPTTTTQQDTQQDSTKRKQSTTNQDAEDARNQAEADSEVSQINTQPPIAPQANEEGIRYSSMSISATPSLRKKGEVAQVIAPYEATSSEQLSLTRGQLIMIRKKTDSGWWEGELQAKGRRRQIGWFPATYVKILQGGRNSGRNTPVSASKVEISETVLDKVIALYPYKALNDDELSFDKDDIISVLGRDEPEWWRGELNGTTGLFPSNYVGPFVTSGKKTPTAVATKS